MTKSMLKQVLAAVLALAAAAAFAAADANTATQAELESIKGIGPSVSQQIIEQRNQRPFDDWHDLRQRVKGLGTATAGRLSAAGLTVNGAEFGANQK